MFNDVHYDLISSIL